MSRYKRGDVVKAPFAYFDKNSGLMTYKIRPFIVIDVEDETDNITVSCSSQLRQSKNFKGIIVYANSSIGKQMGITQDSFIYCNQTITLSNKDILGKIGTCQIIEEIIEKLNS
jgi:PemK-like, MazF-like toxin of type II toxin-antitoxin system